MGKQEVIDYVMNSPANTNRAVLSGMLDDNSGSGTIQNNGFFIVHTTDYDTDEGDWSKIDATFEEIQQALYSGQIPVLFVCAGREIDRVYYFAYTNAYSPDVTNGYIEFRSYGISGNTPYVREVSIFADGTIQK